MPKQKTAVAATLQEAADEYLRGIGAQAAHDQQGPVRRFVQWCDSSRAPGDLRAAEVERFVEENSGRNGSQPRSLDAVRAFLAWLKKNSLTPVNLSTAIKTRRGETGSSTTTDPNAVQMTREGYEALQRELEELKESRPQIAEALRLAMADKDFRENAPLDAARDQQAHVEAQIRRLEQLIKYAQIVEGPSGATGAARVGSKVMVVNLESSEEIRYHLVSPSEVNPREGKISVASPVGKALVDRIVGDEVSIVVPRGTLRLRVAEVEG